MCIRDRVSASWTSTIRPISPSPTWRATAVPVIPRHRPRSTATRRSPSTKHSLHRSSKWCTRRRWLSVMTRGASKSGSPTRGGCPRTSPRRREPTSSSCPSSRRSRARVSACLAARPDSSSVSSKVVSPRGSTIATTARPIECWPPGWCPPRSCSARSSSPRSARSPTRPGAGGPGSSASRCRRVRRSRAGSPRRWACSSCFARWPRSAAPRWCRHPSR